jgi:hypothetical protein
VTEQTPAGQYASELTGLVALFQRLGRSVYGLAVLEAAWLGLLALLAGLGTEGNGGQYPLPFGRHVSLPDLAWFGMGAVAVAWLATTRGPALLVGGRGVVHLVSVALRGLGVVVAFLVNVPLLVVLWPVEAWRVRRKVREAAAEPERAAADGAAKQPAPPDPNRIRASLRYGRWAIVTWAFVVLFVRGTVRRGAPRLAVTPFAPYDVLRNESSALEVREVVLRAVQRLQVTIPARDTIQRTTVLALPTRSALVLRAADEVQVTDLVLTGRYQHPTLPIVTLERYRGRVPFDEGAGGLPTSEPDKNADAWSRTRRPFDDGLPLASLAPLTLDLRRDDDVDLAVLLCLAQVLYEPGRHVYLPPVDPVLEEIARRCLELDRPGDLTFSATGQALRVAGAWVGRLIGSDPYAHEDFWRETERPARFLLRAAEACVRAEVDVVDNLLRAGALHCLLGDEAAAEAAFRRVAQEETSIDGFERITNAVLLERTWTGRSIDEERRRAMAAAYGARAIALGDAESVATKVNEPPFSLDRQISPSTALTVLDRLLAGAS